ncbi:hypothetical protein HU200_004359 [Digitaria exilis]|uniref:WRKY domain-containing protein n=1 Tax=Digitaria exilis TaxID=1010633 RepID=A0A835FVV0_9POAL|nr:hypothetical protein HU200_004359 [Digitaria exilis]
MAGAAGDSSREGVGGDGDWAFAEYTSSVFAELGWPDDLAAELPVLDLPEAAAPPLGEVTRPEEIVAPARSGDAAAASSSSSGDGDGAATGSDDRKPAAETAELTLGAARGSPAVRSGAVILGHAARKRGRPLRQQVFTWSGYGRGNLVNRWRRSACRVVGSRAAICPAVAKKGQKRARQPRFAFMTKSEIDHLEDGYRWRKYGQKAVKNSPFPSKCAVKKRVERSSADPSVVITTYEGQHCHHIGSFQRGSSASTQHIHSAAAVALAEQMSPFIPAAQQLYSLPRLHLQSSPSSETVLSSASTSLQHLNGGDELRRRTSYSPRVPSMMSSPQTPSSVPPSISVEMAGLLDDMVPHGVRHG